VDKYPSFDDYQSPDNSFVNLYFLAQRTAFVSASNTRSNKMLLTEQVNRRYYT
jgi:hypothetical protein